MRPLPFSVQELKDDQLFGIPLTITDTLGNVVTYPDTGIERAIRAAINTFERELHIDLWPRKIICRPQVTAPTLVLGPGYDIAEDPMDYTAAAYYAYGYIRLRRYPIISVESVSLRFPEDTTVFDYPANWLRIQHQHGQISIMAIAGASSPAIIAREGGYLPLLTGGLMKGDVPQLIYVNYTSGLDWTNPANIEKYQDLFLMLQKQAAVNVLLAVGRGIRPGVTSESLSEDGQSESTSYYRGKGGIFGPEIEALNEEVQAFLLSFKAFHRGPVMTVL